MLIKIDAAGLRLLQQINFQVKDSEKRWYYAGNHDRAPIIVVARGQKMVVGQIWDANPGNEKGFPGFCRPAHEGKKVGKITLVRKLDAKAVESLEETAQVIPLSEQINWILRHLND